MKERMMQKIIQYFKDNTFKRPAESRVRWALSSIVTIGVSVYFFLTMTGTDTVSVLAHELSIPGVLAGFYGLVWYGILGIVDEEGGGQ